MNFLDAVKALNEGKCKGIKRKGYIDFLYLNEFDRLTWMAIGSYIFNPIIEDLIAEDWEMVGPVKQYEEVEIVRYIPVNDGKLGFTFYDEPPKGEFVKLTGTIKKQIKPKVKRRKLIATCDKFGNIVGSIIPGYSNSKIYEEWEEYEF